MNDPTRMQPKTVRVVRDPLVAVTCIVVLLTAAGWVVREVRRTFDVVAAAGVGRIETHSYTGTQSAHVTFTNVSAIDIQSTCMRGVVTPKAAGGTRAVSAVACTGEMKPRTTVALDMPYDPGAVEKACAGDDRRMDWDRCTFGVEPVPAR